MKNKTIMALCAATAWLWLPTQSAQAVVLDWDLLTWNAGDLSNTYYASSAASPTGFFYKDAPMWVGVGSVTITVSGDTSALASGSPSLQSGHGQKALEFLVDFSSRSQSITVTVTFNGYSAGADQTSFSLFDVDASGGGNSNYIDQVRNIRGSFGTTNNAADIHGSSKNDVVSNQTLNATVTGSGPVSGGGSSQGNVGIDWGGQVINQFQYTFGNSTNADANPQQQVYSLHDISFRPKVPEASPGVVAVAVCGLAMGLRLLRSRKGS